MSSAHILYLDDEEPLVFIVKRMLERVGHRVAGFTNADAALAAFTAAPETFDLVICDMAMPGMSGIDFAKAVLAVRPEAAVVIASGAAPDLAHAAPIHHSPPRIHFFIPPVDP